MELLARKGMGAKKESLSQKDRLSSDVIILLCWCDSVNRANIGTRSAVGANIRINHIDITFGDRFNRALIDAGAASCAVITDFISHFNIILRC